MTRVSPFLTFNGQCAAAMDLYEKALAAKVTYKTTYAKANEKDFQHADDSKNDWIYHAQIKVGRQIIMMCDGDSTTLGSGTEQRASEVCLCAEFATPEEVQSAFDIMSEGGIVIEPMSTATYSKKFVFIQDKFGIRWWLMTAE